MEMVTLWILQLCDMESDSGTSLDVIVFIVLINSFLVVWMW